MLPRSSQTNIETGVTPAESIRHLQEYGPEASSENSTFPKIDKDESDNNSEHGKDDAQTHFSNTESNSSSDFTALLPNSEFKEILGELFVTSHKQLFDAQYEIRNNKKNETESFDALTEASANKIQTLRKHRYQLQIVYHNTPKGDQYDMVL
ncbi:hypothetical protein [Fodinibius halophilus]|uniref:Uncharacterized protein n=1 Tax=Fodinibius halophilus TaxID=1736908 RepID=A0A6M1T8L6_9BACT|nr:hypothetical protein [Fodinibius halophilus]NGP87424.1 hypothetical protein [Fodinibius halophilus]